MPVKIIFKTYLIPFPRLARELEENQAASEMLILMNDGWVYRTESKI